ncbi:hypothetical protein VFPPC_10278 [Pochonia chlamydosporia 170]|uniref:Uncharacterized protein n=1 Tax=Pochonia chlamydosporia 170 TaxID=1380566 RepID=A0A179F1C1_METCM|nr:hypothetical protein VFPPC_10278 [Pochonia chlamydosporia 170]OAQ59255.1 hypothetical protein VFPPC_10278 [Pochonia chlamydosporia 170]
MALKLPSLTPSRWSQIDSPEFYQSTSHSNTATNSLLEPVAKHILPQIMDEPEWMKDAIAKLVKEHGAVPPPWFMFPDTHPYEICWRMGAGETHIMNFSAWWDKQKEVLDEQGRIEYFRRWPPPPRWLEWMIDAVWEPQPPDSYDESFDYTPYFERVEALGFGSQAEYEQDLEEFGQEDEAGEEDGDDDDDHDDHDHDDQK